MDGKLFTTHCTSSKSKTCRGDQWVTVEIEVDGHRKVRHLVDGEVVLEYEQPQLDPKDDRSKEALAAAHGEKRLAGGTIALQSESHPIEFRKVEIQLLDPPAGE